MVLTWSVVSTFPDCYVTCKTAGAPPLVGAMDAISAMLKTPNIIPTHTRMVVHMAPAVPPFAIEKADVTIATSYVFPSTTI